MGLDLEARRKTSGVWANAWGRQPGKSEAGGSGGIVRRGDWWWGEETRKSCPKALQGDPVDDDWSGEAGVSHRGGHYTEVQGGRRGVSSRTAEGYSVLTMIPT